MVAAASPQVRGTSLVYRDDRRATSLGCVRAGQPRLYRALPKSALYLGEAGGTSVIYDAEAKRTWRIPSSELNVAALPTLEECP